MSYKSRSNHLPDGFKSFVEQVFSSSCDYFTFSKSHTVKYFWDNVYVQRQFEQSTFYDFMQRTESSFLLITGPVGSGKSSYVLHKLELGYYDSHSNLYQCNGLRIDLSALGPSLDQCRISCSDIDRDLVFRNFLDSTVKNAIREYLVLHIMNYIADPKNIDIDNPSVNAMDFVNGLPKNKNIILRKQANRLLAGILAIFTESEFSDAIMGQITISPNADFYSILNSVSGWLESHEDVVNRLFLPNQSQSEFVSSQSEFVSVDWAKIFSRLFSNSPLVIFLDEADALELNHHPHILQFGEDIGRAMHKSKAACKIVLALRDENVPLDTYKSRMKKSMHIQLSQPANGIASSLDSSGIHSRCLPLQTADLESICVKRLELLSQNTQSHAQFNGHSVSEFVSIFTSIIQKLSSDLSRHGIDYATLLDATNESIRLALDFSSHSALEIMQDNKILSMFNSDTGKPRIREQLILWLFNKDTVGHRLENQIREELDGLRKGEVPCGVHRLVLSYLYTHWKKSSDKKPSHISASIGDLTADFYNRLEIEKNVVLKAIWALYEPSDHEREFLSLFSEKKITNPEEITDEIRIAITPRGRTFVRRLMQTVEHWIRISPCMCDEKYDILKSRPLSISNPLFLANALSTLTSQEFVPVANGHLKAWFDISLYTPGLPTNDSELLFPSYSRFFGVTQNFYLERVASSHIHVMLETLMRVVESDPSCSIIKSNIFLSFQELHKALVWEKKGPVTQYGIEQLNEIVSNKEFSDCLSQKTLSGVNKLLASLKTVSGIRIMLSTLRDFTRNDMRQFTLTMEENRSNVEPKSLKRYEEHEYIQFLQEKIFK